MLELLRELRDYLESTMYNDGDAAYSGNWFCPECMRLIRSVNNLYNQRKNFNHDNLCKLNDILLKTIEKIKELENDKRTT